MIVGSRIFLRLNFMVDLCKAKPCLNQFINQTRSSSLGLHLFSAVTFHKIESRCLHSGGTMLFCSVWWSKYWILCREAFWINNTQLLFIFLQYIHFLYKSHMQVKLIIVFKRPCLAPFLLVPSFVENSSELDLGDIFYGDHIFGDIWEIIKVSDDKIGRAIYPRYQDTQLPSPLPQWGKEPN